MTNPVGQTWKYEYDVRGDKTAEIDPEGNKRTWTYNEDSQEISETSPRGNVSGAEASKFTTTIERDAQGRPITVTEPGPPSPEHEPTREAATNTAPPAITGLAAEGQALSTNNGEWRTGLPLTYTYQWESCDSLGMACTPIVGAVHASYEPTAIDVGNTVRVVVVATSAAGSTSSTSNVSGTISGREESSNAGPTYVAQFAAGGSGAGEISSPWGMATDSSGDVWIADSGNNRVEEFSAEGSYMRKFGTNGPEPGQFKYPEGIAVEPSGTVVVSDSNDDRIEEFTQEGTFIRTFGTAGAEAGEIQDPEGIGVNSEGDIFVADRDNHRIDEFTEEGEYLRSIGAEAGEGQLEEPSDVAVAPDGDLLVSDVGTDRIEEFTQAGAYIRKFGDHGDGAGQLESPWRLAIGPDEDVWVVNTEDHRVEVFSLAGEYLFQFGSEGSGEGEFAYPIAIAGYGSNVYVVDGEHERIERWSYDAAPANGSAPNISGEAVAGQTLSASTGTWVAHPAPSYAYQWQACNEHGEECHDVEGATGKTYEAGDSDLGAKLRVAVTATNSAGSASAYSAPTSVVVSPSAPSNVSAPAIGGTMQQDHSLDVSDGSWTATPEPSYSYQWQRCSSLGEDCADISGATQSAYVANYSDVGHKLRVVVTATNVAGEASSYSALTELIAPLVRQTKYTYDAAGDLETVTDAYGATTIYTYNAENQPIKVQQPDGTTTETEYNAEGQVISETNGDGRTTRYARNELGQVTEVIEPGDRKTIKEYDAEGNPASVTAPSGKTAGYTYNAGGELTKISYSDEHTPTTEYSYNDEGNMTSMTDGTGTTTYKYDQLGRLTEVTDGHGEAVNYEYNLADQQTKIIYPNGKSVERGYDNDGRLHSVTDWIGNTTTFSYDPDSNLTATKFPAATEEEDTYTYDDADQPSEVTMAKNTETLASLAYVKDDNEQITGTISKGLPGEEEQEYAYYLGDRLAKAGSTAYQYDHAGNITRQGEASMPYNDAEQTRSQRQHHLQLQRRRPTNRSHAEHRPSNHLRLQPGWRAHRDQPGRRGLDI